VGGQDSPAPSLPGYARYLAQGPSTDREIELSRFEPDQQPLLPPTLMAGAGQSSHTLPGYSSQPPQGVTQYPPPPGSIMDGRLGASCTLWAPSSQWTTSVSPGALNLPTKLMLSHLPMTPLPRIAAATFRAATDPVIATSRWHDDQPL